MGPRYTNAAQVLPEELLAAVREKVGRSGCFLWIPAATNVTRARRNEMVVRLQAKGHSVAAIADRLFISQRTVFRILARARAESGRGAGGRR
jgi:DNA-binding NarL/FixJ family response regulator